MNLISSDRGKSGVLHLSYTNTGDAPVTLNQAKKWAKVSHDAEDSIISDLIGETIDLIENEFNFSIIDKTVTAKWDSFSREMDLPLGDVKEITSVTVTDSTGDTVLDTDDYRLIGNRLIFSSIYDHGYNRRFLTVVYTTTGKAGGVVLGLKKAIASNFADREDLSEVSAHELINSSRKIFKRYKNWI